MSGAARASTRDIARAAVRAELAQAAFDLVRREGFEHVTVSDLASAAGVSRATFLRYFASKEDAVLAAFDAHSGQVTGALRARPPGEDDWTALRRALDTVTAQVRQDPASALATTRLVLGTPALCAQYRARQDGWRPALAQALASRGDPPRPVTLADSVRAAAAMDCLHIALQEWIAADGRPGLAAVLDKAFAALALPQ